MTFLKRTEIEKSVAKASPREISRLDKLREEMCVPWGELNKLAKEVVGRNMGDVRNLTVTENREVINYMRMNRRTLQDRYRKMVWNA